jgi:hypothetical protein
MDFRKSVLLILLPGLCLNLAGQDEDTGMQGIFSGSSREINSFIRGGMYVSPQNEGDKTDITGLYSDLDLSLGAENGSSWKAFTDLRFRYGAEFGEPVSRFDLREGYVKLFGRKWDLSAGQQIIKWGRADFTNPTSKLNPVNYISRSPDREDMDLGNISFAAHWYPAPSVSLGAVMVPLYRPSVLLVEPFPMPAYVTFSQNTSISTEGGMVSYGLKADFRSSRVDWSLSWFDGYDPMPGINLTAFNPDYSMPIPVFYTDLSTIPYRLRMAGADFELTAGDFGIRGEGAWTSPVLSHNDHEYVPFPELKWVAGIDWSAGKWRIMAEYSGKYVLDYSPATADPVFGTEPDYQKLAELFADPGLDPEEYVKQQVASFNRLYNYHLEQFYHSAGLKLDADIAYGKLLPSVFTMYNFTSRDLLLIPEIKYKPADGLTITAGAEIYHGSRGSLFDIVNEFMTSVYVALRVDF